MGKFNPWRQVSDFYLAGEAGVADSSARADQYAEFVYFHPFVRDALYGKKQPMAVLQRDDVGE